MTRKIFLSLIIAAALLSLPIASSADDMVEALPSFSLPLPENQSQQLYLGLAEAPGKRFEVSDVSADILLLELFSMYCPFCQEEAPAINDLYELTRKLPETGLQVKMIGLGAGNSAFEVEHFRSTYDVAFPLFPDQDLSLYKLLRGEGTPGFIGAKRGANGAFNIILRQSGGFYSAEEFLAELLKRAQE